MNLYHELDMVKGWFIGGFEPAALKSNNVEVAIKRYKAGFFEEKHYHCLTNEITFVVSGQVKMNDQCYSAGTIIVLDLEEATDFYCVTDVVTCCVKVRVKEGDLTQDKYRFDP